VGYTDGERVLQDYSLSEFSLSVLFVQRRFSKEKTVSFALTARAVLLCRSRRIAKTVIEYPIRDDGKPLHSGEIKICGRVG